MTAVAQPQSAKRSARSWLLPAAAAVVLTAGFAGLNAWLEQPNRVYPLDLDGWGHLTGRLDQSGHRFSELFEAPSLWKGPLVPFLFGLAYYVAPFPESILVFNVLACGLGAGVLVAGFTLLGARPWLATAAVLLGTCYWPHRYVFGYYFAEPVLLLLSAVTFFLAVQWTVRRSGWLAFASGLSAGVLLLARAPFFLVVIALPIVLWFHLGDHLGETRRRTIPLYLMGLVLSFAPWGIRNHLVHGAYIPFTTEGGMILFQGTYLAGDDAVMNDLRQIPEFQAIETRERVKPPIEQYRSWQKLAMEQFWADVPGQLRLMVRKAIRFWVYLPPHSWTPNWKTAAIALVAVPLAAIGVVSSRRSLLVQLCLLWVLGLWSFHALVHAELRYNLPILPMGFMLVMLGITRPVEGVAPLSKSSASL